MGFLHKIWDDTLAGPTPDAGLGKLRKYDSFSAGRSSSSSPIVSPDEIPVSRSITILRTNSMFRNVSVDPNSVPTSPAGSSAPSSPFSPSTPRGDFKRFTRRKPSPEELDAADTPSLTVYDWIVINALDR